MDRPKVLRDVTNGAVAGAAATVPMSVVMVVAQQLGLISSQPPEHITKALLNAVGVPRTHKTDRRLSALNHFAYGAACGAVFALARRRQGRVTAAMTSGVAFSLAVWWASYEGWVPAMDIMPPVEADEPGRPEAMAAAHVAFGLSLAAGLRALRRR